MTAEELQLVQEVDELTELFRTDQDLADIRKLVSVHGLNPNELLLVGWMEGEVHEEYACFATLSGELIDYEGRSDSTPREPLVWKDRSNDPTIVDDFAAAAIGRKMAMGKLPNRWIRDQ